MVLRSFIFLTARNLSFEEKLKNHHRKLMIQDKQKQASPQKLQGKMKEGTVCLLSNSVQIPAISIILKIYFSYKKKEHTIPGYTQI